MSVSACRPFLGLGWWELGAAFTELSVRGFGQGAMRSPLLGVFKASVYGVFIGLGAVRRQRLGGGSLGETGG